MYILNQNKEVDDDDSGGGVRLMFGGVWWRVVD